MSAPLELLILDRESEQLLSRVVIPDTIELGRQNHDRESLYSLQNDRTPARLAIAPLREDTVSRDQVRLERKGDRLKVTNLSATVRIQLLGGPDLPIGGTCDVELPTTLDLKRLRLCVQPENADAVPEGMRTLPGGSLGSSILLKRTPVELSSSLSEAGRFEELLGWLQATTDVLQSAASSSDFFAKAAQGIVDIAGLDRGRVLLFKDGVWTEAARHWKGRDDRVPWDSSQQVLALMREQQRTFWHDPSAVLLKPSSSIRGTLVIVASPVMSPQNEVIGALYGDRRFDPTRPNFQEVNKVAAMLVELLARGVGLGLARMEQEKQAVSARVQFEQFFTPELARELQNNRAYLEEGRDCDVSVLFCDIRGFSRISERLGPQKTIRWIRDVLSVLSACVLKYNGVLVDYIGDELMAMWGAPQHQPDHATRACQAALDMLATLPELSARWEELLEEQFSLGIGINSGIAHVGNIGSTQKFKYGPLGNTVNLASRVQGVTKYLKCSLLVTESTQQQLNTSWATRRVCQAKVVNIVEPVMLYELAPADRPRWQMMCEVYEKGLQDFEGKAFRVAARGLANLLAEVGTDGPTLVLMSRAVNALVDGPTSIHPLWEVPK